MVAVQMMEPGVRVRLQSAREAQMPVWMFVLAVFRVGEPHRWRSLLSHRPVVAHIRPEAP